MRQPTAAAVTEEKEWQKLITEYDERGDKHIAAYNKYTADPTDAILLDEFKGLAEKAEDRSARADNIANELGETEDGEEFAAKLKNCRQAFGYSVNRTTNLNSKPCRLQKQQVRLFGAFRENGIVA